MDFISITRQCAYESNGIRLFGRKMDLLMWRLIEDLVNPEIY